MTGTKHQGQHKEHLHHPSQQEIFTDPVCGMSTEDPNAFLHSTFEGEKYFFCSEHCLETFASSAEFVGSSLKNSPRA